MKDLTRKLYKINPCELEKNPGASIESQIKKIFNCPVAFQYTSIELKEGTDAVLLGFDPAYKGDRVFAVMFGLYTMIIQSYGNNCRFYMTDFLDEQSLYNSARNIEILVWRLKNRTKPDGSLYLATNQVNGSVLNLSFERIFGQLISLQDTMARILGTRSGRLVTTVVHSAGMAFLPIGL